MQLDNTYIIICTKNNIRCGFTKDKGYVAFDYIDKRGRKNSIAMNDANELIEIGYIRDIFYKPTLSCERICTKYHKDLGACGYSFTTTNSLCEHISFIGFME